MISIELEVPDIGELKKTALRKAHKKALTISMQTFVTNQIPRRFRDRVPGYKPRSRKWRSIKQDIKGPRIANQHHKFTGDTEKKAKRGTIKATAKRVTYSISGLNEGYGRRRNARSADLKKELESMTPKEREVFAQIYERELVKALNNPANYKKRKITSK